MKRDRQKVYDKYDGHCAYCGKEVPFKKFQVDHYYPKYDPSIALKNGITDVDHIDNLMPSCPSCNHYKRAATPNQWRGIMASLHERVNKIYINKIAVNFGIMSVTPWNGKFYFEKIEKK